MTEAGQTERLIDVVDIEPGLRHLIIHRLFEYLGPDDNLNRLRKTNVG
jgi:hypothetical protein